MKALIRSIFTLAITGISVSTLTADLIWHSALDGNAIAEIGADAVLRGETAPVPVPDINGNEGGALRFAGDTGPAYYEIAPNVDSFTAATLSIWVRPVVVDGSEDGIIAVGASGGGETQYFSIMNGSANEYRVDLDDGSSRLEVVSDTSATEGTWSHLVATFSSDPASDLRFRLYLNGILQSDVENVTSDTIYMMTNSWLLGTERIEERYFAGDLDDARIYNNELSAGEVNSLFQAGPSYILLSDMDGDGDGLSNEFEALFGLNPNSDVGDDGAMGDPDGDMLSNIDEQSRMTNPTNPDSDDDMLTDFVETNSGTFVDVNNTGTDPNNPDTDGDMIDDGVETNSGVFVSTADTGTNPLLVDTDGDGFSDTVETNSGSFTDFTDTGTDPTKRDTDNGGVGDQTEIALGTNPFAPSDDDVDFSKILLIGGQDDPVSGSDEAIFSDLLASYGFDGVTYTGTNALVDGVEEGFDLVIISSSVAASSVSGRFQDRAVAVINWEQALADNSASGDFQLSAPLTAVGPQTNLEITATEHPITEVFVPGSIALVEGAAAVFTVGADMLAPGVLSLGETSGGSSFFVAETGAELLGDGSTGAPQFAPARRVHLPFVDDTYGILTSDGLMLFDRSVQWALGKLGPEPPSIPVISVGLVDYDEATGDFSLTWESESGKVYNVQSSADLVEWTTVNTDPIGAIGITTSASFTQDPSIISKLFYRVVELPVVE